MESEYTFILKKFEALTNTELYNILTLRQKIFVVEQNCVYLDNDDVDQISEHLCCYHHDTLIAYLRIIPRSKDSDKIIIGRVICALEYRKKGIGKEIMQMAINIIGDHTIKIGAQYYLLSFYSSLGFVQSSEIYDLDGIPHIDMLRNPR